MTREEAINILLSYLPKDEPMNTEDRKAFEMAIKALEQEPCEDAVSRKAVLSALSELPHEYKTKEQRARTGGIAACQVIVRELPPVTPKPRTGKWELTEDEQSYRCSYCKNHWISASEYLDVWKYCPHCGAKMEGESE